MLAGSLLSNRLCADAICCCSGPDGDIDFSVFQRNGPPFGDAWATRLHSALVREQRKPSSSAFHITDPQIINADVRALCAGCSWVVARRIACSNELRNSAPRCMAI